MIGVLILAYLIATASPPAHPADVAQLAALDPIEKHKQAVGAYRAADTARALSLLGELSPKQHRDALSELPRTPNFMRALGALHMEAAIQALRASGSGALEAAAHHMALAKTGFDAAGSGRTDEERWVLVLGLAEMHAGRFGTAFAILKPACNSDRASSALLVACATLHETFATLPAHVKVPGVVESTTTARRRGLLEGITPNIGVHDPTLSSNIHATSADAATARRRQLAESQRYLERAYAADPGNAEALLRLGNVRTRLRDYAGAALLLEDLVKRSNVPERAAYLGRLFLARVRIHQNRVDDAAGILSSAPPLQSALLMRAHVAMRRGRTADAVTYAEQASQTNLADPWSTYSYGQPEIAAALHTQLREEARR